jgi:ATP-dependent RNA helicase DOB1
MGVKDSTYRKAQRRSESLEQMLHKHALADSDTLQERLQLLAQKQALDEQVKIARKEAKAAQSLILKDELKARRRVLRRLGHVDSEGVVAVKGRVAAEIQSADELVLTELIFNGVFKALGPDQIVSLLSACVWREPSETGNKVREDMQGPYGALLEAARRVAKVSVDSKMAVDVEEYVASFRPDLMDPVAAWSRGSKFAEVLKMSNIFEGSLVRAVRRIEEVLRQLSSAAQSIGDVEMQELFELCRDRIKRDIIFAASLYL